MGCFWFPGVLPGRPGRAARLKISRGFKPAVLCAVFLRAWLLVAGPGLGLFLGVGIWLGLCSLFGAGWVGLLGLGFWLVSGLVSGAGFWLVFGRVWVVVFRALILGRSGPPCGPKHGRVWDLFFSNAVVFGRGITWCSGFQT